MASLLPISVTRKITSPISGNSRACNFLSMRMRLRMRMRMEVVVIMIKVFWWFGQIHQIVFYRWTGKDPNHVGMVRTNWTGKMSKKVRTKYHHLIWYFVCWYFVPTPDRLIFNCCDEKYLPHCWHLAAYPNCTYCGYPELQFLSNGGKTIIKDHK